MKRYVGWLVMGWLVIGQLMAQPWPQLRVELLQRMQQQGKAGINFPPVCENPELPANARYERDTIWVGQLQSAYQSTEDSLSILYHEWQHVLQERAGRFELCLDSLGQIPQWQTDEWYDYQPDSLELAEEFAAATSHPWWANMDSLQQAREQQRLWRDLQQPRRILFVYAPSILAEAEIEAYERQLAGELAGLYQLSLPARQSIHRRLRQLKDTLKRRRAYEQANKLSADGCCGIFSRNTISRYRLTPD